MRLDSGAPPPYPYRVLYVDPPWRYRVHNKPNREGWRQWGVECQGHYPTMSIAEMAALPVGDLVGRHAALFMWVTSPLLREAFELMDAWGFAYKTKAFSWVKVNRDGSPVTHGLGHYTKSNTEDCLLAIRGSMPVTDKTVAQIITAPRRQHSRKPDDVYSRIERLYPRGPYVELFARQEWPRWDQWGNEAGKMPAEVPLLDGAAGPLRAAKVVRATPRHKPATSYSAMSDMWAPEAAVAS